MGDRQCEYILQLVEEVDGHVRVKAIYGLVF